MVITDNNCRSKRRRKRKEMRATYHILVYLEDEMGIEPDLIEGRKDVTEKTRSEIDEGVGKEKPSRYGRFSMQPTVLAQHLKAEKRKHSSRYSPSTSSIHPVSSSSSSFFSLACPFPFSFSSTLSPICSCKTTTSLWGSHFRVRKWQFYPFKF